MGEDFTVSVCNPERKAIWEAILGTATVHVKSPIPSRANLPGHPNTLSYELDLDFLTEEQRQRLIAYVAARFGFSESEVAANLDSEGMPILASDCVVSVKHPQKWF
jgi:hypothetical protein